jgi:CheY-like chemotaxis protein
MKLLIVEGNATFRRLIGEFVAPLATDVCECPNGADALRAYEAHRPDVVLMDLAMPTVDGLTATASIVTAHPEARVVMVTQYDGPDLREAARKAGASGYVLKDNLFELRQLLEQSRTRRSEEER